MGKILLNCRKVSCERRNNMSIPASEAKSRLIEGNKRFINATSNPGDVSLERRVETLKNGQHPAMEYYLCRTYDMKSSISIYCTESSESLHHALLACLSMICPVNHNITLI